MRISSLKLKGNLVVVGLEVKEVAVEDLDEEVDVRRRLHDVRIGRCETLNPEPLTQTQILDHVGGCDQEQGEIESLRSAAGWELVSRGGSGSGSRRRGARSTTPAFHR